MRKNIRITIVLALVVMLLWGCNSNNNSISTDNGVNQGQSVKDKIMNNQNSGENGNKDGASTPNSDKDNAEEQPMGYDHSLVCDKWSESGTIKVVSDTTYEFKYDYKAPQIVDDTEDAKAINELIESMYEYVNNVVAKAKETGSASEDDVNNMSRESYFLSYECYWNDSVASIVLTQPNYMEELTPYMVFNYDFETGKQLNSYQVLDKKGISMEQFVEDIRRAVVYETDNSLKNFFKGEIPIGNQDKITDENIYDMYARYLIMRSDNMHSNNVNELMPIYMDDKGELKAIVNVFDMGLIGNHVSVLSGVPIKNYNINERSDDSLYVESREDGIYIIVNESVWAQRLSELVPSLEVGKEYKINGANKNYCDAAVSWVGNGMQPYVLLISDDGMAAYVDVELGILSDYMSLVEPMIGIYDLKNFERSQESNVVMAENQAGELVNVDEVLYLATTAKSDNFERILLDLQPNTSYYANVTYEQDGEIITVNENIGFQGEEYQYFARNAYLNCMGESQTQKGNIIFNGMNEKGIVYAFYLVTEESEYLRGTMAIYNILYTDEETMLMVNGAVYSTLGGYDIFKTNGEEILLTFVAG